MLNLRVFIVDDDVFCRQLYYRHLLNLGIVDIHVFENGEDCMANMHLLPDLVFLDYNMAPYDGLLMIDKVKSSHRDAKVILISGQKEIMVAVRALQNGAVDYIIKGDNELDFITNAIDKLFSTSKLTF
jgi:DNA-binding NtrC family response regulator